MFGIILIILSVGGIIGSVLAGIISGDWAQQRVNSVGYRVIFAYIVFGATVSSTTTSVIASRLINIKKVIQEQDGKYAIIHLDHSKTYPDEIRLSSETKVIHNSSTQKGWRNGFCPDTDEEILELNIKDVEVD